MQTWSYSFCLRRAQQERQDSSKNTQLVSITAWLFTKLGLEFLREWPVTDVHVKCKTATNGLPVFLSESPRRSNQRRKCIKTPFWHFGLQVNGI